METNKRKEKLVKILINKDFEVTDEDELIEMLLDNPTAIDSDKEEDERRKLQVHGALLLVFVSF